MAARRLIAALALAAGALCASAPLRVVTYNIRYDNPGDGPDAWIHRREAVLSLLRFHGAELVCLQEGLAHQVRFLAGGLGFEAFGAGRDDGREAGEHCAILFDPRRFERLEGGTFWLSPAPERPGLGWDAACPRIATWVRLREREGKGSLLVFDTHLDHVGAVARAEGARLVQREMARLAQGSLLLLAGDFNSRETDAPCALLTAPDARPRLLDARSLSRLPHHGPRRTFKGFAPAGGADEGRIDFIFVGEGLRVLRHATLAEVREEGHFPSDHLPVLAELAF